MFISLLVNMHSLYTALSAAQTCPLYTAGITSTTEGTSTTTSAVYVNANSAYDAECDGTVYAWHYCYYPTNSQTDLEAAFGVFSVSSGVYSLREGSYYLLHLDTRETSFTCDSVTLNSSQYFQIHNGDTVGPIAMYTPYYEVYPLLRGIPPIARYTPYCEVYPLLRGIPPIARYTPYYEVYPLLRGIPPIAMYTPYYEVYPLLRGISPIARYICAIDHKIYPLFQSIPPITK